MAKSRSLARFNEYLEFPSEWERLHLEEKVELVYEMLIDLTEVIDSLLPEEEEGE